MRIAGYLLLGIMTLTSCDENRVYEKNEDLPQRQWMVTQRPEFEFLITNTDVRYNLYCNVRNEISYPYSRLFYTYYLRDSTGAELRTALNSHFLFDKKTGEPFGRSGLGDIYDHQFLLLENFEFRKPGKYAVQFEQFMRKDTLQGILSVGLRVERVKTEID